ncbi:MAG: hypothetical protein OXE50_00100 [Chloroflexi bacterium]|nr:hypothetical protein [Chloroflexota bacterium]
MNIRLPLPRRSIAARGQAIYRKKVRPLVYPHLKGKVVVIDVDSGDYEIDEEDLEATVKLLARRPDARTWGERIGYKGVESFGGLIPDDDH